MKIKTTALLLSLFLLFQFCQNKPAAPVQTPPPTPSDKSGRELATIYCGSCHQFPEPNLLDKATWTTELLPNMGARLGIKDPQYNPYRKLSSPDAMMVQVENIFPETPLLAVEDWTKIVEFYKNEAPSVLTNPKPKSDIGFCKNFVFHKNAPKYLTPLTTLVQIDTAEGQLYIGTLAGRLLSFSSKMQLLDSFDLSSTPVAFSRNSTDFDVLVIGNIYPNEMREGSLLNLNRGSKLSQPQFTNLRRPVHFAQADFSGDGQTDVAVCEYGYQKGQLSWFEKVGNQWKPHILSATSGATKVFTQDFDKDGRMDLAALFAQGDERVSFFYNKGKGEFEEKVVLRFPPVYGSADVQLVDFNKDGKLDILYSNGDNEDFSPILKPYHGIRLFLNDGNDQFTEGVFLPMHGAFQAAAADFDGDGDLDIAAVAFFPDDRKRAASHFLYFEQTQSLQFKPQTIREATQGKWMTMSIGDADHDGDVDILLGSFQISLTGKPSEKTGQKFLPFAFLENKLH